MPQRRNKLGKYISDKVKVKCAFCGKNFEIPRCKKMVHNFCRKDCLSKWMKGKCFMSFENRPKKGVHFSPMTEFKKGNTINRGKNNPVYKMRKEDTPNWKGGITPLTLTIRHSFEYRQWRSDIFTRDDFTCQKCGKRGIKIVAHHIKRFSLIFEENKIKTLEQARICEEFWNINNGITLCKECH